MTLCTSRNGVNAPEPPDWFPCCMASAVYGYDACTCWEPQYDQEQAEPDWCSVTEIRKAVCHDCAYRPDSPERSTPEGEEALFDMPAAGKVFYCHQGMVRVVRWHHPDGRAVPGDPSAYEPLIEGGQAFRGDGQAASVCAGWRAQSGRSIG